MSLVPRPVFLCLPAMGTPIGYYGPFLTALERTCDATVEPFEIRGQGESEADVRRGADFGYRELVEEDLPKRVEELSARYPDRPLYLIAHSLGAQVSVLASPRLQGRVAGLVLIAAGTAHFRAWPLGIRWRVWGFVEGVHLLSRVFPWYPGKFVGFGGDQPKRLMRDWTFNARTGRYHFHGSAQTTEERERELARVELPILSITIAEDPIAPEGAEAELLAHLPRSRVTRRTIDGVKSHKPWRRHFTWARAPEEIVEVIARWLQERAEAERDVVTRAPNDGAS